MKKYSIEWLAAARFKPLLRGNTKPFPGKYPTRVAWQCRYNGKLVSYVGKPSPRAFKKFHEYRRRGNTSLWAVEFDRKGIIGRRTEDGVVLNSVARGHYHPLGNEREDFFGRPFRWIVYPDDAYPTFTLPTQDWAAMLEAPDVNPRTLRLPARAQRAPAAVRRVCWPLDTPMPTGVA
jgi:hypothetical protein